MSDKSTDFTKNQPKFYIQTYGCQMNEYDSNLIKNILINKGYSIANSIEESDCILINTCTVREKADNKVYSFLGNLKESKKIIGVIGCLVEKDGSKLIGRMPHVNFIVGPRRIKEIPDILDRLKNGEKHIVCNGDNKDIKIEVNTLIKDVYSESKKESGYVTIMQGCSNYCSYCVVPYVRGKSKSRNLNEILTEVKNLVSIGIKEITLLGQNVNSYGQDLNDSIDFTGLLKEVIKISEIEKIKFMTSHPKDISSDLIELIAVEQKISKHIHLPVQSGSDRILKLMNRGYTREKYLEIVKEIKNRIPNVSITTDVIVGFPGESEKDFEDTLNLLKEVKFDSAFTFKYSKRDGTPASKMSGEVDKITKEERLKKLMEVLK